MTSSRTKPVTAADCVAAIREHGSVDAAARPLGVSPTLIRNRLDQADIDIATLERRKPIVLTPARHRVIQIAQIQRAIELGLWHIDDNGDVQPFYRGDPWRGNGPNLLDRK